MAFELVGKLQLVDQMSAPLRSVSGLLGGLGKATDAPTRGLLGLANSGQQVNGWGGSFNAGMQGIIGTLGKVATAIGVTKLAMDTVKTAMNFDSRMASIGSISPEAKAARESLEGLAMEMGMKTKYSATEAAEGIENLIRAGRSVSQVMSGDLKASLNLAAADEMNLADAAEIVSDNLNAFKRDGIGAADVADILAGASAAASTDVAGLQMGLKNVGSVAGSVGMTLRDTSAALGLMSNNGIKGSDAGTAMKTMLMRLQPKGKKATEMMKKLGIMTKKGQNTFYDASGQLKSLADISEILKTSLAGLTDQQRAAAMEIMFGSDAVRAANVLFEAGAEGVNKFQEEMSQTTALQMAADKLDSASGAAEILKGVLSTLQIVIGKALLPVIKDFCKWAADSATMMVEWFQSAQGQETLAKLSGFIANVIDKIRALCTWLGERLSPLFNRIKTDISNVIIKLKAWFASDEGAAWFYAMKAAAEGVIEIITNVYTFFSDNFTLIAPIIAGVVAGIVAFNAATAIMGIVTAVGAVGGLGAAAAACWTFTAALLANPITWIVVAVFAFVAALVFLWLNWEQVSAWLSESWEAIKTTATEVFGAIGTFLTGTWENISSACIAAWESVVAFLTGIWESISSGVSTAWETITSTITNAWNGVVLFFTGIDLSTVGTTIINTLLSGITSAWTGITSGIASLWASVSGFFSGISLTSIGSNIINGLWEGLKSAWTSVTAWFSNITSAIPGWVREALGIHSPSRVMMELGEYTMQGFAIGLDNEHDHVENSAVRIAETPQMAVTNTLCAVPEATPDATGNSGLAAGGARQYAFHFGDIILQGVSGDMHRAADEFMAIIAERLQNDGGLVPEGV